MCAIGFLFSFFFAASFRFLSNKYKFLCSFSYSCFKLSLRISYASGANNAKSSLHRDGRILAIHSGQLLRNQNASRCTDTSARDRHRDRYRLDGIARLNKGKTIVSSNSFPSVTHNRVEYALRCEIL